MLKICTAAVAVLAVSGFVTAETFYVAQDGSGDFSTIQDAIDFASEGDEIIVGPGTYTSTDNEGDDFDIANLEDKWLIIRSSHGPEVTILDGQDQRRSFRINKATPGLTVIDGFTMQNGREYYGGALSTGMSEPTIKNCVIRWNHAIWWGGGIVCHGEDDAYARVTIIDCDIYGNSAGQNGGGGVYLWKAEATVDNCAIRDNSNKGFDCYEGSIINMSNSLMCSNSGGDFSGSYTFNDLGGNCFESSCIDSDSDGTFDCLDDCPDDPDKTEPGICGCGVPEIDCVPVQWKVEDGGNGHWYGIQNGYIPWTDARDASESLGGQLCSMETVDELNWLKAAILEPYSETLFADGGWGICIGGIQTSQNDEPYGNWEWLTGVPFECNSDYDCNMENYLGNQNYMSLVRNTGQPIQFNDIDNIPDQPYFMVEWSADCNGDGIVDYGQILDGSIEDLDENGIPDCCQDGACLPFDCNGNNIADADDLANGTSQDCNENGIPDECDIDEETSIDCNGNQIPDECETLADCDGDGTPDACEILNGALDANPADGIPDACQGLPMGACCFNGGCLISTFDECFAAGGSFAGAGVPCSASLCPASCPGDVNGDNQIGIVDLLTIIDGWGICP